MIREEIKLKIDDVPGYLSKLRAIGAVHLGDIKEIIYWCDTPNQQLKQNGVYLRLRTGFKNTLTLKRHSDMQSDVRCMDDYEIEIDNVDQAREILKFLGYTQQRIMEKYRLEWQYKNTKITIDELPFGVYTEIVGKRDRIREVCRDLGLDFKQKLTITYWEIWDATNPGSRDIIFMPGQDIKIF